MSLDTNIINEKTINDINYELLKKQFPHAVSIDEDGKYSIDPQKLQMSLDPSKANIKEDGYGLNWVGKKEAYHTAFSKNYKVLKPLNDENSKNWDTTDNILIKGDNLDALKILRQNYFEAIKMIYIDPPYNTKNDEFVYNDDFTTNTEETLEALGYDKEYVDYIENIQGAKTHSGWLSFMYPRLLLARDLLKDDGVIFISIDDNEVAQLKLLCDEVFGGENFIANLVWEKRYGRSNDAKLMSSVKETILLYRKSDVLVNLREPRSDENNKDYSNPDNDPRGLWTSVSFVSQRTKSERPNCAYELINTHTNKMFNHPTNAWKYNYEKYQKYVTEKRFYWGKNNDQDFPRIKLFLDELEDGMVPIDLWKYKESGTTDQGTKEVVELIGKNMFTHPKPTTLIQRMLKLASSKTDIILDFFAGSGTTAHAVMDLNAQDGGNRKFICVQWAEETPEKSEAKKAGYETIFDITKERIKRAGEKIIKDDLTKQDLDIGFRTFDIVEDLKQKIYQKPLEETEQKDLLAFTNTIVESTEDILYNLLVAESLPLSSKIETLIKDKLYKVENVAFILGDITIDELISKLKNKKELEYITVYSPNISDDKFTLECESAVSSIGIKSDKLRFRG